MQNWFPHLDSGDFWRIWLGRRACLTRMKLPPGVDEIDFGLFTVRRNPNGAAPRTDIWAPEPGDSWDSASSVDWDWWLTNVDDRGTDDAGGRFLLLTVTGFPGDRMTESAFDAELARLSEERLQPIDPDRVSPGIRAMSAEEMSAEELRRLLEAIAPDFSPPPRQQSQQHRSFPISDVVLDERLSVLAVDVGRDTPPAEIADEGPLEWFRFLLALAFGEPVEGYWWGFVATRCDYVSELENGTAYAVVYEDQPEGLYDCMSAALSPYIDKLGESWRYFPPWEPTVEDIARARSFIAAVGDLPHERWRLVARRYLAALSDFDGPYGPENCVLDLIIGLELTWPHESGGNGTSRATYPSEGALAASRFGLANYKRLLRDLNELRRLRNRIVHEGGHPDPGELRLAVENRFRPAAITAMKGALLAEAQDRMPKRR